jgi:phosphoserine phosphatase
LINDPALQSRLPLRLGDFRLVVFDMDSTLINIECIDEVADAAGKKAEVAAITEASMRGEIADFTEGLRRRVAMLRGVPVSFLETVYEQRLRLNPGAQVLVHALQTAGLYTMIVSGGFSFFAERVQTQLGLDEAHANVLEIDASGCLTGRLLGQIIDGDAKRRLMLDRCAKIGCDPAQAIAVGDGANDLPMMGSAGLSVAYHAKPKVRAQAKIAIEAGGLDRLLDIVTSTSSSVT